MRVAEAGEVIRRAAEVERAGRFEVWHQHAFFGAQDLGRLAHEAHAGDDQRLAGVVAAETGHFERVRDAAAGLERQVLDVAVDVVVRHEHGVVFLQQGRGARLPVDALLRRQRLGDLGPGVGGAAGAGGVLPGVVEQHLAHGSG
jgi:hypothetical protein